MSLLKWISHLPLEESFCSWTMNGVANNKPERDWLNQGR